MRRPAGEVKESRPALIRRLREMLLGTPDQKVAGEWGWGGARMSGGISQDEHLQELRGKAAAEVAAKMRRTHGQVRAVQTAISLPIQSAVWILEPPSGATAAEREATELLRENLFGGMETSWTDLIREATLAIYYGYRVPEVVWEERGGLLRVQRIASRNPELVERWLYDAVGRLVGYLYVGQRPTGQGLTTGYGAGGTVERIPIPLEKTLHFGFEAENDTPVGFGLWRSMYPHWHIVQTVYKIMCIGIERNLLPVPVGRLHPGAQTDDRDALLNLLRRWRADHQAAAVLSAEQSLEYVESARSLVDALPFVEHHNGMIALTGLAQFMRIGLSDVGTQAVGSVHAKIFLDAEESRARWIQEVIQRQLIARWMLLNYPEGVRAPRLLHGPITSKDLGGWTAALQSLVAGRWVTPLVDDEEKIRQELELPEIPREQLETARAQVAGGGEGPPVPPPAPRSRTAAEPGPDPCCEERGHVGAEATAEELAQEAEYVSGARTVLEEIQGRYLAALRPLVQEAEDAERIAQGRPIDRLTEVTLSGRGEYARLVRDWLWRVLQAGRETLAAETGQDLERRPVSNRLRQWVTARAEVIADQHLGQLRAEVLHRVLSGLRAELPAEQVLAAAESGVLDGWSDGAERDWHQAAAEVLAAVSRESAA